jgi:hypothetical protein
MHLANISYRVGHSIEFDPAKEQIVKDGKANDMLLRKYGEPFVVPEKVLGSRIEDRGYNG